MSTAPTPDDRNTPAATFAALFGLILVATAQVSNMILARAVAGTIPPFAIAFFRWGLIAAALAPFAVTEARAGRLRLGTQLWAILATGFLGMFLCGGPVYAAGATTSAINIAMIMALSPIMVLLIAWMLGLERISRLQLLGMALALAGALAIIARGSLEALTRVALVRGDLLVLLAMLGWSDYTLLQVRVAREASFLARVSVFAAAGALFSFPFAAAEAWSAPGAVFTLKAAGAYLFAGIVPGVIAYAGFAYLTGRFGAVRTSLILYLGPPVSALLSWAILGEPPGLIHLVGGTLILLGVWASLRR